MSACPVRRMVHAMAEQSRPAWAAQIQAEREARRWNKREMARRLLRARFPAVDMPDSVDSVARQIRGWEAGAHFPRDWVTGYATAFGLVQAELFGARENPSAPARRTVEGHPIPPAAGRAAGPVAPELADYFRDQLAGHYAADRHLGPLRLIPTAVTQYELLCELANTATGPLRPKMWALAAGYSAFVGWLYQDGGDLDRSVYWHDVMIERAHRSLDPQLVAFALHNKAMLHVDMRDGLGVVDLASAALVNEPTLCAKVRVLALQQLAHGTALAGGDGARKECDELLDKAAGLVGRIDDPYPWGSACESEHYLEVQRATCYVRLGLADEALTLWDPLMKTMAGSARRDLGVFRARQAQALAVCGEPERAVEIAGEVAVIARDTGSVRMRRELADLQARMAPWAQDRVGLELRETLRSIGE